MKKKADRVKASEPTPGPFNNPFGALGQLRDSLPSKPAPEPDLPKSESRGPARAVVRLERKGRGGKDVSVVSHLELPAIELEKWLKTLKNKLGCGGSVEGDVIVLQGDQRDRLPDVLTVLGVRKVTVG